MTFDYTARYSQRRDGDFDVIPRPEVPVIVLGPGGKAEFLGIVDTGSDYTIFPASIAEILQIDQHQSDRPPAFAVGGSRLNLTMGEATLELCTEGETIRWTTDVHFLNSAQQDVILGRASFLEYFTATFDGKLERLTLEPNENLPAGVR